MPNVTGVIGISSPESSRYALFYSNLTRVEKPPHTALAHVTGPCVPDSRNKIADQALGAGAEWIWFVDDDHIFPVDTLTRLLAHNVSVVSGLYLQRCSPYKPQMYDREDTDGALFHRPILQGDSGLKPVLATGAGCLLVRTAVLKQLEPPYWQFARTPEGNTVGEDIDFCRKVREKGFTIWCDMDVRVGHYTTGLVYPTRDEEGNWGTIFIEPGGTPVFTAPPAAPELS